ncbi:sodium-coupled monocarboxylate transporter 1-like [Lycorma delicatula]|uniref:sodium-coupled monocarboxylate transporter 1-like n=1 Tax=Lycorma delicatula TaxID=130591 RepID=UPI003F50F1E3
MGDAQREMFGFGLVDYGVFGFMLLISALIGFYHGCNIFRSKKKKLPEVNVAGNFLTANGQLSTLPVALSMLASFLSSITLMGQPAEVYLYGPQMWLFGVSSFAIIPLVGYVMVPFYRGSNYTSAYEYIGNRFNRRLQFLTSFLFSIQMVLYLALVLYAPALAMHQVTGFNTIQIVTIMYIVCIFYTTIGGMKAVVWADSFQVVVLYTAMMVILVKGTNEIGGIKTIWEYNALYNRTDIFNLNWDPTERYSALSALLGSGILHIAFYGGNQLQVQRYFSVKSNQQAVKMLWINSIGWTVVVLMTVYTGMLIFAKYNTCDPLAVGIIKSPDQLFPLYVMDTLHDYPGIPGLFISGIFSAGLSTVATGVNSLAAIWFAELNGTVFKQKLTEKQAGLTVKGMALGFGIISYLLVFLVPYMGGLVPVAISLSGVFAGSIFGLFVLGMFMKRANTLGGTVGLLASIGLLIWMILGALVAENLGQAIHPPLPTSTEQCYNYNDTSTLRHNNTSATEKDDAFFMYRISYLWYCLIATFTTVVVGALVSILAEHLTLTKSNIIKNSNNIFSNTIQAADVDKKVNHLLLCEDITKSKAAIVLSEQGTINRRNTLPDV